MARGPPPSPHGRTRRSTPTATCDCDFSVLRAPPFGLRSRQPREAAPPPDADGAQASRSAPAVDRRAAGCTTRGARAGGGRPAAGPRRPLGTPPPRAAGSPPLHSWANRRGVAPLAGCPDRPWALGCSARLLRLHCSLPAWSRAWPVETGASIDAHASADASVDAPIVDTPIFDARAAIDDDTPIETPATASNEE
ncbi:hypothetical protein U9M48_007165, partial [Paspalum notatum var. saurae]